MRTILGWMAALLASALVGAAAYQIVLSPAEELDPAGAGVTVATTAEDGGAADRTASPTTFGSDPVDPTTAPTGGSPDGSTGGSTDAFIDEPGAAAPAVDPRAPAAVPPRVTASADDDDDDSHGRGRGRGRGRGGDDSSSGSGSDHSGIDNSGSGSHSDD